MSLAVRRAAVEGEPEIIVIHGMLDRAATFVATQRLLDPMAVTLYDRRGYGRSQGLAPKPDLSVHVADALRVARDRRVVLIGHSFGGLVALATAVAAPEQVRAVGVYEPPMPWLDGWPDTMRRAIAEPGRAVEQFFGSMVGTDAWERLPERFRDARRAEEPALIADVETVEGGVSFDLADVLSPVAAAHGSATSAHYKVAARAVADQIYGTDLHVIEGAAHGVHLSHASAFAGWIRTVAELGE